MHALGTRGESVEVTAAPRPDPRFIIGLAGQSPAVEVPLPALACAVPTHQNPWSFILLLPTDFSFAVGTNAA